MDTWSEFKHEATNKPPCFVDLILGESIARLIEGGKLKRRRRSKEDGALTMCLKGYATKFVYRSLGALKLTNVFLFAQKHKD